MFSMRRRSRAEGGVYWDMWRIFHYLNNIDLFCSFGLKEEWQDIFAVISRNLFAYGWSMIMNSYSLALTWHGSICSSLSVFTLISHRYFIWKLIHHSRKYLSLIHVRLKKYSRKSLSSLRFSISSIHTHSKKYLIGLCSFLKKKVWLIFSLFIV